MDAGGGNRAADLLRSIRKMKRRMGEEEEEEEEGEGETVSNRED